MSGKKQYQYQIDEDGDNKEIEMQANVGNNNNEQEDEQDIPDQFNEKSATPSQSQSKDNKKRKGAARLKAKKGIQSASTLESNNKKTDSTPQSARQNQSAIINFNNSLNQSTIQIDPQQLMNQFNFISIQKDPNYSSLEKTIQTYHKGEEVSIPEQQLTKVRKIPKRKRGFLEMFSSNAQRYILLDKGNIYTLRKMKKDTFWVSSCREFSFLYKIYEDKSKLSELKLYFYNKGRDPLSAPVRKQYEFPNQKKCQEFLNSLNQILKLQGFSVLTN